MASTSPSPPQHLTSRKSRRRQRYQLCEEIGVGGTGTVYRAFDRELNRTVAVKVLRPEMASGFVNLLRLKRELVLASRVSHEHVVRVHDIGEVDGRPLIAMDWVEGETLAQLLQRVRCLSPSQTCTLATQMCEGLRSIHAAGIVHRDLKPGNLLIRTDGTLLVSDFGLARSSLSQDLRLTEPGDTAGTVTYMAPERFAGLPADSRSDLYAMGLILLEMLTGATALETLGGLRSQWLSKDIDNSIRFAELRKLAALDIVIRRCLLPDRTERYADAGEALHDIHLADRATASEEQAQRRATVGHTVRGHRMLAVFLLIAAILCSASWAYFSHKRFVQHRLAEADKTYTATVSALAASRAEGKLQTALEGLDRVLELNPNHVPAIRTRLEIFIQLYDGSRDQQWLRRAQEAMASPAAARLTPHERLLFSAKIDLNLGSFGSVIRSLENDAALLKSSKDANLLLGRALQNSQQPERALSYFRAAIRLSPDAWRAHNDFGYALLGLGRVEDARREFLRVTQLEPDLATGYSSLGVALLDQGNLAGAHQAFESALQRAPSPEAYYNMGVTAYYSRDYASAMLFFEEAIRIRPDSDRYLLALGDTLRRLHRILRSREAYTHTLVLLNQVAQSRALTVEEQSRLALCYARLGDGRSAVSLLDNAGNRNPNASYARAIVAFLAGRKVEAKKCLADAVRFGFPAALLDIDPDLDDLP